MQAKLTKILTTRAAWHGATEMPEWLAMNWGNVIGVIGIVLTVIGLRLSFKG
jgi:hypothetical protein